MSVNWDKQLTLRCDCSMEILAFDYDKGEKEVYLSMFKNDSGFSRSLWQRLRFCWQTLTTGRPYTDNICLNDKDMKQLKGFITEYFNDQKVDLELDLSEEALAYLALESAKQNITVSEVVESILKDFIKEEEEKVGAQQIDSGTT